MARLGFREQLIGFDDEVRALFTVVSTGVNRASQAFLAGTPSEATRLGEGEEVTDTVLTRVEQELQLTFARQAPVATDLRFMLTVLRIVPQLERCVELSEYIAQRAGYATALPADVIALFESMASATGRMWDLATAAWVEADAAAAARLDEADDEVDVLADELTVVLGSSRVSPHAAMECRLVARFYERLGDHAVHVCERIRWWATGQ